MPAVSHSALAQDGLHFKDSTTAICIDRRKGKERKGNDYIQDQPLGLKRTAIT